MSPDLLAALQTQLAAVTADEVAVGKLRTSSKAAVIKAAQVQLAKDIAALTVTVRQIAANQADVVGPAVTATV